MAATKVDLIVLDVMLPGTSGLDLCRELIIVAFVCVVLLLHVRSALVALVMLPVGVLMAFAAMHALGISATILSLGGIAIAIGAMVDAAIGMIAPQARRSAG